MLDSILDGLGRVGAWLALMALAFGTLAAAIYIGHLVQKWTGKAWTIWVVSIVAFVLLALVFGPTMHAVQSVSCRGNADYQACMDGE